MDRNDEIARAQFGRVQIPAAFDLAATVIEDGKLEILYRMPSAIWRSVYVKGSDDPIRVFESGNTHIKSHSVDGGRIFGMVPRHRG